MVTVFKFSKEASTGPKVPEVKASPAFFCPTFENKPVSPPNFSLNAFSFSGVKSLLARFNPAITSFIVFSISILFDSSLALTKSGANSFNLSDEIPREFNCCKNPPAALPCINGSFLSLYMATSPLVAIRSKICLPFPCGVARVFPLNSLFISPYCSLVDP